MNPQFGNNQGFIQQPQHRQDQEPQQQPDTGWYENSASYSALDPPLAEPGQFATAEYPGLLGQNSALGYRYDHPLPVYNEHILGPEQGSIRSQDDNTMAQGFPGLQGPVPHIIAGHNMGTDGMTYDFGSYQDHQSMTGDNTHLVPCHQSTDDSQVFTTDSQPVIPHRSWLAPDQFPESNYTLNTFEGVGGSGGIRPTNIYEANPTDHGGWWKVDSSCLDFYPEPVAGRGREAFSQEFDGLCCYAPDHEAFDNTSRPILASSGQRSQFKPPHSPFPRLGHTNTTQPTLGYMQSPFQSSSHQQTGLLGSHLGYTSQNDVLLVSSDVSQNNHR